MKQRSHLAIMAKLITLVRPLTGYMVLAILLGLLGHLCAAFLTVLGGYALFDLMGFSLGLPFPMALIFLFVFALARGFLRYGEQSCNHFIAFKLLALLRDKVFSALRRLCPAKLEGRDKGDLISVITSDIELLEVFYAHTISPCAIALLFSAVMCLYLGSFHWLLALLALVAYLTIGIVVPVVVSKASKDDGLRLRTQSGELSSFVLESLRGLSETIQYAMGASRLEEMNRRTQALSQEEEKMKGLAGRNMAVTNTLILFFDFAMLFAALALHQQGALSLPGVVLPVLALMSSFGPVVALANLGSTLQSTFAAGNRVLNILEETPVVEEVTGEEDISFTGAQVNGLSFSYGGEQILSDISLSLTHPEVVGIVGKSGSGKSTLLKLLMRFWQAQQGSVQISGVPIQQVNTANLRDMESFMTQETHLFHDSIANNLRIAKADATQQELEEACKKASIHSFILSLPQGYDTPVGELGDTLSGGERQRLGLARAFLHDAPFLLLDEPTSNLDSLNEGVILTSLKEQAKGKTVVLVSHRPSTMRIVQKVYSVEQGRMS